MSIEPSHNPTCVGDTLLGVGVIVQREGLYLLGLRCGDYGFDTWGFPGGKVEPAEDPLAAAVRELQEETSLVLANPVATTWGTGWVIDGKLRHVTLFVKGFVTGTPIRMEPDKCLQWAWFPRDALPQNVFEPTRLYFDAR